MRNPQYRHLGKLVTDNSGRILESKGGGQERPSINSVAWSSTPKRLNNEAEDVIAVTGASGTYAYFRTASPKSMEENWHQLFSFPGIKGTTCIWNTQRARRDRSYSGDLLVISPPTDSDSGKVWLIKRDLQTTHFSQEVLYTAVLNDTTPLESVTCLLWANGGKDIVVCKSNSSKMHTMRWIKGAGTWQWIRSSMDYTHYFEGIQLFGCCCVSLEFPVFAVCSNHTRIEVFKLYVGPANAHWQSAAIGEENLNTVCMAFNTSGDELAVLSADSELRVFSVDAPEVGYGRLDLHYIMNTSIPSSTSLEWSRDGIIIVCGESMEAVRCFTFEIVEQEDEQEDEEEDELWMIRHRNVITPTRRGMNPLDKVHCFSAHPIRPHILVIVGHQGIISFWENGRRAFQEVDRDLVFEKFFNHVPLGGDQITGSSDNPLQGSSKSLVATLVQELKEKEDSKQRRKIACGIIKPFLQKFLEGKSLTHQEWGTMAEKTYNVLRDDEDS